VQIFIQAEVHRAFNHHNTTIRINHEERTM
jgi:hypothetical protein